MSFVVKGVTLPDIPADVLAKNPYAAVVAMSASGSVQGYALLAGETDLLNMDLTALYGCGMLAPYSGTPAVYTFIPGGTDWVVDSETEYLPVGSLSGNTYEIIWANHSIMSALYDENFNQAGFDIYRVNTDLEEKYNETSAFFSKIAFHTRRINKAWDARTMDRVISLLDNMPMDAGQYDWIAGVTITEDSANKTVSITSDANEILFPSSGAIGFRSCGTNPIVEANFPNAKTIGDSAFIGHSTIQKVNAPMVELLGMSVFEGCTALTSVEMPALKETYASAFNGCTALTSIDLPSLEKTGFYFFQGCVNLTSVNLPALIEVNPYTFDGCSSLKEITLPSVTNVAGRAFKGCTALEKVDFPSITNFGYTGSASAQAYIFNGCTALTAVIIRTNQVCSVTCNFANLFINSGITSNAGYIYVPAALVDSYKADATWSGYAHKIRAIEDYPDICGTAA